MSKMFDNLDYGSHFTDEHGTRWIKVNCNSAFQEELPFFRDRTGCRCSFNAVDYNGLMAQTWPLKKFPILTLFLYQIGGLTFYKPLLQSQQT